MAYYRKVVILGDTLLGDEPLGIQRNTIEILKELDKIANTATIEILIPNVDECSLHFTNLSIVRYGKKGKQGFFWRQFVFPEYVRKERALAVDLTLGLSMFGSDVVCLYDCIYENYPNDFYGAKAKLKRISYLLRARLNVMHAKRIVTISVNSKRELCRYYGITEDKIHIIYPAWQHIKVIVQDDSILDKLKIRGRNFLFSLGSQLPHKNFKWIIEAAKQNPEYLFVVTGSNKLSAYEENYDLIKNVIFTGFLSDQEIKSLMIQCKAFVFPSLYEGFGIPPMEALACGSPIMISDKSCLPEIYDKSAVYFDPLDYHNIDLDRLMSSFPSVGEIDKVLERFSWSKAAKEFSKLINDLIEENN